MSEFETNEAAAKGPRVYRSPATATWKHEHKWGRQFGDYTTLSATRVDGGALTLTYGKETFTLRPDLVPIFAEMVAAAAAWSDSPTDADGAER